MALINCCECGNEVSEYADKCPKCGCPVSVSIEKNRDDIKIAEKKKAEEEKIIAEKKAVQDKKAAEKAENFQKNKKKIFISLSIVAALVVAGIVIGLSLTKEQRYYRAGLSAFEKGNYSKAYVRFIQVPGYEEADNLAVKSAHYIDVANDKAAPIISGIEDGEIIDVDYCSNFNVKDYVAEKIKVEDAVSGTIDTYIIKASSDVYDYESGEMRTDEGGNFDFSVTANDEAGNNATTKFTISIDETLHLTGNTKLPVVVYDGDLGIVTITEIKHYSYYGTKQYEIDYSFENKSADTLDVYMGQCYLNDNRLMVYSQYNRDVDAGKKGTNYTYWEDTDMTDDMKGFENIEIHLFLGNWDPSGSATEKRIFDRPLEISSSLIEYK